MKWNEMKSTFSAVVDIHFAILTTTVLAFTDLKAQCEYRWYRRFAKGFAAVYEDSNNLMRCILHGL